jgi:ribosomal protein S18 acetylase RimI-like enzyme
VNIAVRYATLADSERIARLVTMLGYPVSASQMRTRLEEIVADDDYVTLVACDNTEVVGFIGTRVGPLFESDGLYGQIMALAIANDRQRRGTGRVLIEAAESELAARGARVVLVTSGHQRADAHAFYEKNGYAFTGRRYTKVIGLPA